MATFDSIPAVDASSNAGAEAAAIVLIVASACIGLLFALLQTFKIRAINMKLDESSESLVNYDDIPSGGETRQEKLETISTAIQVGAKSFLIAEYSICLVFLFFFGIIILILLGTADNCGTVFVATGTSKGDCWADAGFTMLAFYIGGLTSIACGAIGMVIAVYTNVRTTVEATRGWTQAFNAAFRGGAVMGFCLSSLGLLILYVLIELYRIHFISDDQDITQELVYLVFFEAIAGYGLGGSTIALFGRVGGGIYTKAADVGADLVGKVEKNIPEDDPRNPATIADNVGDNVGDIAGMGADLFGSFAESTSAALVLSATSVQLQQSYATMLFPLIVSATGILACILTSFVATNIRPVNGAKDVQPVLKTQLILSTVLITPLLALMSWLFLPDRFTFGPDPTSNQLPATANECRWWGAFIALASGLWAGLITGLITEYYTSYSYKPVKEVAAASDTGAATVIIYGLALGYKSAIIPVIMLAATIWASFYLVGLYGVSLAALGMLSSFSIGLTIDGYGPITDNAGGIAEMAELGEDVRNITDTLDAAGNTTAAIGKGFAIGSAALVSLALFGAYVTRVAKGLQGEGEAADFTVNILTPITFCFLLIGAMIPYWFSAMTMKSVGVAAYEMVNEVRRQFREIEGIMEGTAKPDYERCVAISTRASLREMIPPAMLVILSPILTGYIFGVFALAGLLAGSLVSSVQLAISASNTGGAWDNAKKYVEQGHHNGKGSENHKACVVGDTVGDPLKDTSGPSLNIVLKLMAIISLVFANSFVNFAAARGEQWAGY